MTRYTVVWDDDVENAFFNSWLASDSATRVVLTDVANWIDTNLANDAELKGRYRTDISARVIDVPLHHSAKIAVTFQVQADDMQVRVTRLTFRIK